MNLEIFNFSYAIVVFNSGGTGTAGGGDPSSPIQNTDAKSLLEQLIEAVSSFGKTVNDYFRKTHNVEEVGPRRESFEYDSHFTYHINTCLEAINSAGTGLMNLITGQESQESQELGEESQSYYTTPLNKIANSVESMYHAVDQYFTKSVEKDGRQEEHTQFVHHLKDGVDLMNSLVTRLGVTLGIVEKQDRNQSTSSSVQDQPPPPVPPARTSSRGSEPLSSRQESHKESSLPLNTDRAGDSASLSHGSDEPTHRSQSEPPPRLVKLDVGSSATKSTSSSEPDAPQFSPYPLGK